jgi:hypothetical protein
MIRPARTSTCSARWSCECSPPGTKPPASKARSATMRVPPLSVADSTIMNFSPLSGFQTTSPARTGQDYPSGADASLWLACAAAIRTLARRAMRARPGSKRTRSLGTILESGGPLEVDDCIAGVSGSVARRCMYSSRSSQASVVFTSAGRRLTLHGKDYGCRSPLNCRLAAEAVCVRDGDAGLRPRAPASWPIQTLARSSRSGATVFPPVALGEPSRRPSRWRSSARGCGPYALVIARP